MKTDGNIYIYIMVMAISTYFVRALPLTVIRGEIQNPFLKSFFHYVPYATIAAMILPDALFCTSSIFTSLVGLIVALYFSYKEKDLVVVSLIACIASFFADVLFNFS